MTLQTTLPSLALHSSQLRKVYLDARDKYLDTVVLQHAPLSMEELLSGVSNFRSCMFDLISNYSVLFPPTSPPTSGDHSLLLAKYVYDKTESFIETIAGYTTSMQGMTLSSVKDVLESLDFLSNSMRVFV